MNAEPSGCASTSVRACRVEARSSILAAQFRTTKTGAFIYVHFASWPLRQWFIFALITKTNFINDKLDFTSQLDVQRHWKLLKESIQVPPFLQGILAQSSVCRAVVKRCKLRSTVVTRRLSRRSPDPLEPPSEFSPAWEVMLAKVCSKVSSRSARLCPESPSSRAMSSSCFVCKAGNSTCRRLAKSCETFRTC